MEFLNLTQNLSQEEIIVRERERIQRELVAKYLQGEFGDGQESVNKFKAEMERVKIPLNLVTVASKIKFKL